MDSDEDLALQTLLAVRAETAPHLDEDLLRQCYLVQKRHQFNSDRAQPMAAMERLIDTKLAAVADGGQG